MLHLVSLKRERFTGPLWLVTGTNGDVTGARSRKSMINGTTGDTGQERNGGSGGGSCTSPKEKTSKKRYWKLDFQIPKGRSSRLGATLWRSSCDVQRKRWGETRGGFRGDKEAWFWNDEVQRVVRQKKSAYKRWQKTRAPEDLAAYRTSKRLAKAAVAKAKNTEMDALYEKLDSREGEKFVFRLAKARHRATRDIGVVKSVRNSEGAILRKPGEVRRRWEEYFDGLLNEEFARQNSSQLEATAGPINLWTENEVRRAMGKIKVGKASGPDGVPIEAWKALGEYGVKWLTRFLNTVTAEGRIPDA
nr:endonuclease-reverse transcriptase HmRTE-e01 [Haemonchus contortus]